MFKKTLLALFAGMVGLQVQAKDKTKITILQTADIHAYLNTHNELFVENGELQFREAGGIANIKTLVNKIKKENPEGTLLVDGGDLIQGSGESVLSEGAIFPPLIEDMQYDLLIPGNWEVIYGKKVMMDVMQNYNSNVIVSNMFHEEGNQPL
ncbi:MAG TPA: metallophosphoesterase, partial [Chitinophagaceae bacterium]|nr:metallophosphoesterase [Chitinophagaceae bacterium]